MDEQIIVIGAGGHAKTLLSMLRLLSWDIAGIVDDRVPAGTLVSSVPVLGTSECLPALRDKGIRNAVNAVGGIGNYSIRWAIFEQLQRLGFEFPTIIHPTAFVEDTVRLDCGVQVLAQSYISSESSVGFGTLINAGVIISHDAVIGKCVNLSPGALLAGNVTVEDFAQIGMGATINLGLRVGSRARVGNNATVKANVPEDGRVYAGMIWPTPGHKNERANPSNLPRIA